jgi:hypothetical protein
MQESSHLELSPLRQKTSKRALPPYRAFVPHDPRQRIETAGSLMASVWPNTMHAVTPRGVELQVFLLVLAYSINCL